MNYKDVEKMKNIITDEDIKNTWFGCLRENKRRFEFNHYFFISVCCRRLHNRLDSNHKEDFIKLNLLDNEMVLTEKGSEYLWLVVSTNRVYTSLDYRVVSV